MSWIGRGLCAPYVGVIMSFGFGMIKNSNWNVPITWKKNVFFSFFDTERNELKSNKQRSKVSKQKVEDKLEEWQLQKDPQNHSKSELIKNSSKMDFKSGVTKVIVVVQ